MKKMTSRKIHPEITELIVEDRDKVVDYVMTDKGKTFVKMRKKRLRA